MPQPTSLAVSLLLALAGAEAKGDDVVQVDARNATIVTAQAGKQSSGHLSADGRVRDLLNHPAFAGFGRLLLPWDNRAYDEDMRLSDLGALLPYHSHVTPEVVVGALNRMIDDARDGKPIFYDFYSAAQKKAQPAKANTGLFFFRGKPGAPFAVISPGGGFAYVGSIHEGFPYAEAISAQGYNAFVLRYRAGLRRRGRHGGPGRSDLLHRPQCARSSASAPATILCGAALPGQGWQPPSARVASRRMAATIFQSHPPW